MTQSGIADDFGANDDAWRTFLQTLLSGRWQTVVNIFFFFQDWFGFRPIAKRFHNPVAVLLVGIIARFYPNSRHSASQSLMSPRRSYQSIKPTELGKADKCLSIFDPSVLGIFTNPAPASLSVCSSIIRLIAHPGPSRPYGMMALILKLLGDSSGDISYGSLALINFACRMPL